MTLDQRIFIVDDDESLTKAIARLMRLKGYEVLVYHSAQEFIHSGNMTSAGCLILDLTMPGMDGLGLQEALRQRSSALSIVFLTGDGDIDSSVRAMKKGASDFLTKPVNSEKLLQAVDAALLINQKALQHQVRIQDLSERLASLTPREKEVLVAVVAGTLNKNIAASLGTSEQTIKVHRAHVMAKMKVDSLASLVHVVEQLNQAGVPILMNPEN